MLYNRNVIMPLH